MARDNHCPFRPPSCEDASALEQDVLHPHRFALRLCHAPSRVSKDSWIEVQDGLCGDTSLPTRLLLLLPRLLLLLPRLRRPRLVLRLLLLLLLLLLAAAAG